VEVNTALRMPKSGRSSGDMGQLSVDSRSSSPPIQPIGTTKAEIKAYLTEVHRLHKNKLASDRRAADRAAEQERRSAAADIHCRASAITEVLRGSPGKTLREMMAALEYSEASQKPDGKRLIGQSLRVAILLELRKPALESMVNIDNTKREKRGRPMWIVTLKQ
jgi:hypothetical protein